MAVELRVDRGPDFKVIEGDASNLKSYSVQEDSTPIDPGSSFGGVGQITVQANEARDSVLLLGEVILNDGVRGKTTGTVRNVASTNGDLTITADSILGLLNSDHTVQPYFGNFAGAIQYYCDLVGIPNDVTVEQSLAGRQVVFPGWTGNVWVHVKQMLSAQEVEMALVYNRVIVRPLRTIVANTDRTITSSWSADNQNAAKKVEVYYYNNSYTVDAEVYPRAGEEATIYQVDANETIVITEQINGSLTSINQPTVVDFVNDATYAGTGGVYSVSGNDGLPITAAQWQGQGGSVRVRITEDPSIIEINIHGASMPEYAPYRIAMSSGSSNFYNSLHVTGTGVVWDKQKITLPTGATSAVTGEEVGITVDNPFISTPSQAYSLGGRTAAAYAGLNYTISGTSFDINRDDASRDLIQATIADFNDSVSAGTPISEFNTEWAGQTIEDFNAYWQATVDNLWANQLFGNAAGARVLTPDANFRIDTATTTEASVQYTASLDTLISDFNDKWPAGTTIAQFNAAQAGKFLKDFSMIPLRRN